MTGFAAGLALGLACTLVLGMAARRLAGGRPWRGAALQAAELAAAVAGLAVLAVHGPAALIAGTAGFTLGRGATLLLGARA